MPASAWHCISALRECNGNEPEDYRIRLLLNVFEDIAWLVEHYEGESVLPQTFLLAREYANEHFRQCVTRETAAHALGVHPNHISRLFHEHAGCTFTEFLLQRRLEHAVELLHDPKISIKEIIYASGFGSNVQFYRTFHRQYGLTPTEYRKRIIAKKN